MSGIPDLPASSLYVLAQVGLLRPYLRHRVLLKMLSGERLSENEKEQAIAAFADEYQLDTDEELERFRREQFLAEASLTALAEQPMRLAHCCHRLFRSKAEARFLNRKADLDRVVYSLIRLNDKDLARELYLQLEEGQADFADLAAEYSHGPERNTRGVVGPVSLTKAHPHLMERLRTANAGVVQEPFQIENWWLVFRLESLTPATFDEATRDQMSQELLDEWLEAEVAQYLNTLRPQLMAAADELVS